MALEVIVCGRLPDIAVHCNFSPPASSEVLVAWCGRVWNNLRPHLFRIRTGCIQQFFCNSLKAIIHHTIPVYVAVSQMCGSKKVSSVFEPPVQALFCSHSYKCRTMDVFYTVTLRHLGPFTFSRSEQPGLLCTRVWTTPRMNYFFF